VEENLKVPKRFVSGLLNEWNREHDKAKITRKTTCWRTECWKGRRYV